MTSSSSKIRVLLIEDEADHRNAIISTFAGTDFDLHTLESLEHHEVLNYRALHPDNQIVIVDLNLESSLSDKADAGLTIIRDTLWKSDRTAFFVIFTQYPEKMHEISLEDVQPHWTFVPKQIDKNTGQLAPDCLKRLFEIVETYSDYCSPLLRTPDYTDWWNKSDK